jgi:hypothetical protein
MKKITVNGKTLTLFIIGKSMAIVSMILLVLSASPFLYIALTEDPFYIMGVVWALVIFVPLGILGGLLMFYDYKRHK